MFWVLQIPNLRNLKLAECLQKKSHYCHLFLVNLKTNQLLFDFFGIYRVKVSIRFCVDALCLNQEFSSDNGTKSVLLKDTTQCLM